MGGRAEVGGLFAGSLSPSNMLRVGGVARQASEHSDPCRGRLGRLSIVFANCRRIGYASICRIQVQVICALGGLARQSSGHAVPRSGRSVCTPQYGVCNSPADRLRVYILHTGTNDLWVRRTTGVMERTVDPLGLLT